MDQKQQTLDEVRTEETSTLYQPVIEIEHLSFAYPAYEGEEARDVLRDVNLTVYEGEFIALLGHNGSGKSTLARLLNAQLLPRKGAIRILGMDTADEKSLWDIRAHCGMVFQNPDNQMVASIVEEDVAFGPENLGIPNPELRERVDAALELVDMTAFKRREPYKLSGGQKQRVAIAGVLAMLPECIILDEPTAMLDPIGRREIIDTILRLNREAHKTILLITHNMEEAVEADRIVVLDEGQIALQGTPREVFRDVETMRALELDVPQVTEVAHVLQQRGLPLRDDVLTISECVEQLMALPAGAAVATPAAVTLEREPAADGAHDMVFREMSFYYGYGTKHPVKALDHINLRIHEHEYIGLIGHTGSGKSTLVQHMNGLNLPQEGTLTVGDITTTAPQANLRALRQQVGLVFQYPEDQLFEETIYKDIAFGPKNLKLSEEEIEARVRWAMASVGLDYETKKDKSPFELSGGQKRRVAIAGVLALKPRYLVLDEPTAGLDPQGRNEILSTIRALYDANPELTIVLVTHSMEDIAEQANRILVVDRGHIVMDGTPHEIFHRRAELEEINLSVPQVTQLMQDLKQKGLPVEDTAITVDEAVDALSAYFGGADEEGVHE